MPNEVVTLESIAAQLTALRDEAAVFRIDLRDRLVRYMQSFVRLENECSTIKAAIGHLETQLLAIACGAQPSDRSRLRTELDELKDEFAALGGRIAALESALDPPRRTAL